MKNLSMIAIATAALVGTAFAGDPKAPTPAPAPTAAKTDPKAAPTPAKTDPKAPPAAATPAMPTVPTEIADMAKGMAGTWKCKGETMHMDGTKEAVTATNTAKVDLDKWWISETLSVTGKMKFKMQGYTTYDASAKKWRRVSVDNWGGSYVGTSDGMKDNKMDWNLDVMGPMGAGQFRDHVDATDAKAGVKMWGEMSMDKGKTWNKVYEMTCKK